MNISTQFYTIHFTGLVIGLGVGQCEHTISMGNFITGNKSLNYIQDVQDISLDITPEARHPISRLCLAQKRHGGADMDIWLLDALKILPVLPSSSSKYIQFNLNLQCGSNNQNNRYLFLVS